jgi:hypothetical protein
MNIGWNVLLQRTDPDILGISPSVAHSNDDFPAPTCPQTAIF